MKIVSFKAISHQLKLTPNRASTDHPGTKHNARIVHAALLYAERQKWQCLRSVSICSTPTQVQNNVDKLGQIRYFSQLYIAAIGLQISGLRDEIQGETSLALHSDASSSSSSFSYSSSCSSSSPSS